MREQDESNTTRRPLNEDWYCPACGRPRLAVMVTAPEPKPLALHRIVTCLPCGGDFEITLWQPIESEKMGLKVKAPTHG